MRAAAMSASPSKALLLASLGRTDDSDRVLATRSSSLTSWGRRVRLQSSGIPPGGAVLAHHHAFVRSLLGRFRGVELDTAGEGVLRVVRRPGRAISCARVICDELRDLGLSIRGVHTGEFERMDGKLGGFAVSMEPV
jgi:hypothetical protein